MTSQMFPLTCPSGHSVTEPQADRDEVIVKILQRLPAFVVAIVPPFARPSYAAVERDDQSCIRLVVVERPVTGGAQHAIAQVDADIAHHCHIETKPPEVAVLDIDRAIGREQLRNEEQNVRREIRARVVKIRGDAFAARRGQAHRDGEAPVLEIISQIGTCVLMIHQREGAAHGQDFPGTIASAQANLAIVQDVGAGIDPVALAGFKIQRDLSFARQTKAETCKPDIPAEAHRLIFPRRLRLQLRVGPDCPVAATHGEA